MGLDARTLLRRYSLSTSAPMPYGPPRQHEEAQLAKELSVAKLTKELEAERARIGKVKDAAQKLLRSAIADLDDLLDNYYFVKKSTPGASGPKATAGNEAKVCPVCGFQTTPSHDGRAHRYQERKKRFTTAQLTAKGMSKVS